MRIRGLVLAVSVGFFSVAAAGEAAQPRRATLRYDLDDVGHSFGVPGHQGFGAYDRSGAYEFPLRRGERSVSVMVLDDTERTIAGAVVQWVKDSQTGQASFGHATTYEKFCGRTAAPVEVDPGITVQVILQKGACEDSTPSAPTTGEIVVDFHRR